MSLNLFKRFIKMISVKDVTYVHYICFRISKWFRKTATGWNETVHRFTYNIPYKFQMQWK